MTFIAGLGGLVLAASWLLAPAAWAQGPGVQTMPKAPTPGDLNEVDEVDEESEGARKDTFPEEDPSGSALVESEVLALSQTEVRSRFRYGAALALGSLRPWETYAIEGGAILNHLWYLAMTGGAGRLSTSGMDGGRGYDLNVDSRTVGVDGRWFAPRLDGLSVATYLGYTSWTGRVAFQGGGDELDDEETVAADRRVSVPFEATGLSTALSVAFSWLWDRGIYLEWTVMGVGRTWLVSGSVPHGDDFATAAVRRDLEHVVFFGLADLKIGCFF